MEIPIETEIETEIKYLDLILEKRLTWDPHLKATRKILNSMHLIVVHFLRPIQQSNLTVRNKIIVSIYKSMLRPIRAYRIQIWG